MGSAVQTESRAGVMVEGAGEMKQTVEQDCRGPILPGNSSRDKWCLQGLEESQRNGVFLWK